MARLYPGAIADLYATREGAAPVTNYREFTDRQTGMYRITTFLSDADAGLTIQKCCAPEFCLKRRLWSVSGLSPEVAYALVRIGVDLSAVNTVGTLQDGIEAAEQLLGYVVSKAEDTVTGRNSEGS